MRLKGKRALVTGAAGGIGWASARALAAEGADVALLDLRWPGFGGSGALQLQSLGGRGLELICDVTDQQAVDQAVETTVRELGGLDILVTSAVYSDRELFHQADIAGFRKTVEVSMWGAFWCLRAFTRRLLELKLPGSAVLISSPHAYIPMPSCMAYNMAKAGLDMMGKTAAMELAPHQIRVNMIYPGWTDTPGERKFFTEQTLAHASRELPQGRLMMPEEVARGVVFLCDDASDCITGTILSVVGGSQLPWWSKRGTGDF